MAKRQVDVYEKRTFIITEGGDELTVCLDEDGWISLNDGDFLISPSFAKELVGILPKLLQSK